MPIYVIYTKVVVRGCSGEYEVPLSEFSLCDHSMAKEDIVINGVLIKKDEILDWQLTDQLIRAGFGDKLIGDL